ncbi:hypothetical protein PV327_008726 [Microctonus hyperodae]|uniref:Uncharacterized protein n=1 Tax=Microctonus hyperodae TaxID=165561 RepID=A0AA39F3R4_MICHY|nr:hypothetical protein PV327_008726 [Microctonus hyperodae]
MLMGPQVKRVGFNRGLALLLALAAERLKKRKKRKATSGRDGKKSRCAKQNRYKTLASSALLGSLTIHCPVQEPPSGGK